MKDKAEPVMNDLDPEILAKAGLAAQEIYGKISASFTHEVKNHLGIMQEQAGLIQDLCRMAEEQGGLDNQKIAGLGGRIIERVGKADALVRRFNAFAHLSDRRTASLELGGLLEMMTGLHERLAAKKPVRLELAPPGQKIQLTARPAFLAAAIFAVTEKAVADAQAGETIRVHLEDSADGCRVCLTWQEGVADARSGPDEALLAAAGASLEIIPREPGLAMEIPR
jgi:nitrogen fixation/metabolism regulation signal transduction histidine kinase